MCLEGGQGNERGYAMAALLVSLAVMMVLMSVAMPVWKTQAQREKEAELIFRGEQIARGINLYMRKMGGASYPPSLDVLVQNRFIRKKYKDPMTENDTSLPMNQRGEWDIINAAGGVLGRKLELVTYDSQGDAKQAVTFVRRLLEDDKVDFLIGGSTTGETMAVWVSSSSISFGIG